MPDWAREVRTRLSSVRLSPEREAGIVDELAQHLDDRWRELIAGGASAAEAARLTLAEFGAGERAGALPGPASPGTSRPPIPPGVSIGRLWGDLWQDLRYYAANDRGEPRLRRGRHPLAGARHSSANTAIFSLWNGVLRAPLPGVRKPEQLVMLSNPDESGGWTGRTWDRDRGSRRANSRNCATTPKASRQSWPRRAA